MQRFKKEYARRANSELLYAPTLRRYPPAFALCANSKGRFDETAARTHFMDRCVKCRLNSIEARENGEAELARWWHEEAKLWGWKLP